MRSGPRDPYREWSYQDRCDARHDPDQREVEPVVGGKDEA